MTTFTYLVEFTLQTKSAAWTTDAAKQAQMKLELVSKAKEALEVASDAPFALLLNLVIKRWESNMIKC